ncbi:MAG: YARHG domain-containing protein, partial [Eubacteriales bacterium]|nr:YARHG domain-containing protein [Eubacteriales bacterium]
NEELLGYLENWSDFWGSMSAYYAEYGTATDLDDEFQDQQEQRMQNIFAGPEEWLDAIIAYQHENDVVQYIPVMVTLGAEPDYDECSDSEKALKIAQAVNMTNQYNSEPIEPPNDLPEDWYSDNMDFEELITELTFWWPADIADADEANAALAWLDYDGSGEATVREKPLLIKEEDNEEDNDITEDLNEESAYLIPGSDTRYITEADLVGLSQWEVRLARNEIYARYGYTFNTPEIRQFFESTDWYVNDPYCGHDNPPSFNVYEEANLSFIRQYERDMGWED